eukprot:scaffold26051_cov201-Cylindrotheca_fusiformis.AAC.1
MPVNSATWASAAGSSAVSIGATVGATGLSQTPGLGGLPIPNPWPNGPAPGSSAAANWPPQSSPASQAQQWPSYHPPGTSMPQVGAPAAGSYTSFSAASHPMGTSSGGQVFSPSSSGLGASQSQTIGTVGAPRRNLFGASPASTVQSMPSQAQLPMERAGLSPIALRQLSPPSFLALCFLLGHHPTIPPGAVVCRVSDGVQMDPTIFVLLRQPCPLVRPVLQEMDVKSYDSCQAMANYLRGQMWTHPWFGQTGYSPDFAFCSKAFVEKAFSISAWEYVVSYKALPKSVAGDAKTAPFSPVQFQMAFDPSWSPIEIPSTGYDRVTAARLGALILLFYQFLDIKLAADQSVDPSRFQQSCFGQLLTRWAGIPAHPTLDAVWTDHPVYCSAWWMEHLLELFRIFYEHHTKRVGLLGATDPCVGIEEVMISPPHETVIVGTNFLPRSHAFQSHSTLQAALGELSANMDQKWVQQVHQGPQHSSWSGPMPEFCGSLSNSSQPPSGGTGRNRDSTSRSDSRENSRKRSRSSAPPFVAQKPLMAFAGTAIPHESPFVTIRNRNGRDWPKILDPDGKVDYCQLCFACCFPAPYNRCKDPEQCSVSRRPAYVRARSSSRSDPPRLHIDLQHSKWRPDNYPERLWASVVDFIKRNKDVVAPSETLKELTPGTSWSFSS